MGTLGSPISESPEDKGQVVSTLVPYSPIMASSPTASTTPTHHGSPAGDQEDLPTAIVISSLIQDLLASANIKDPATVRKFLPAGHS